MGQPAVQMVVLSMVRVAARARVLIKADHMTPFTDCPFAAGGRAPAVVNEAIPTVDRGLAACKRWLDRSASLTAIDQLP